MSAPGFQFKQFYIAHDECAMKVGTDGVLLGSWAPITTADSDGDTYQVLDIGTGSGLVAIMLAQRLSEKKYHIDAIDIEPQAASQAAKNVLASPWNPFIEVHLVGLQDFAIACKIKYHLIVSNPPYFQNSLKNPDKQKEIARHTDSLSYEELITSAKQLLAQHGVLALILPARYEIEILDIAKANGLFVEHITRIKTKANKTEKRILIALKEHTTATIEDVLTLEDENSSRSEEYKQLTQSFYL